MTRKAYDYPAGRGSPTPIYEQVVVDTKIFPFHIINMMINEGTRTLVKLL